MYVFRFRTRLEYDFTGFESQFAWLESHFAGLKAILPDLKAILPYRTWKPFCRTWKPFAGLESHFAGFESHFAGLESNFAGLESHFAGLKSHIPYCWIDLVKRLPIPNISCIPSTWNNFDKIRTKNETSRKAFNCNLKLDLLNELKTDCQRDYGHEYKKA